MKPVRRSTLHDIAERTGVSYQTVSRVINNHPNVSPATRARVQTAITELGYRPNKVARSLIAKQSNTLAVVTYGLSHYGPSQMVMNIERAARSLGYDLIFANIGAVAPDQLHKSLDSVIDRQVDGILAIAPVEGAHYQAVLRLAEDIPTVQIDPRSGDQSASVMIDQRYGNRLITEYLIALGHQRISEVSGPLTWFGAQARHEQWLETLREHQLEPCASVEGDWTAQSGYDAVHRLITINTDFTALVVGNDQMALGAMRALREHNLRIPEDVSVVGFDDIPEAGFFEPPLTTVRQDFSQLGDMGVRYLLERIHNPQEAPVQHLLYPHLIVRRTAAPPRAR